MDTAKFDPYRAPQYDTEREWQPDEQQWRLYRVGETIVFWERLRWIYNAVLVITTLVTCIALPVQVGIETPLIFVAGALGANLCFCAGPLVSGYMTWLGVRSRVFDYCLFVGGLVIALPLCVQVLTG